MPGNIIAHGKIKQATISAVVTRKDGTQEDLGVISYYHESRVRRLWWRIKQAVKELRKSWQV